MLVANERPSRRSFISRLAGTPPPGNDASQVDIPGGNSGERHPILKRERMAKKATIQPTIAIRVVDGGNMIIPMVSDGCQVRHGSGTGR